MGLFKKNLPSKTTIENFTYIPHLERVLLWFLKNDEFFNTLKSKNVRTLFNAGWGRSPFSSSDVDHLFSKEPVENQNVLRYLVINIWRDLTGVLEDMRKQKDRLAKEVFAEKIKSLEEEAEKTIKEIFRIAEKHGVDPTSFDAESDLAQLEQNTLDAVKFKTSFVRDALLSSEIRLLAWIYKELFNEDYKIRFEP